MHHASAYVEPCQMEWLQTRSILTRTHERSNIIPLPNAALTRTPGVVLNFLPSLGVVVLLVALPLEDPTHTWDRYSVFWLRTTLPTFGWTVAVTMQLQTLVPAVASSMWSCVAISVFAAGVNISAGMLLGRY